MPTDDTTAWVKATSREDDARVAELVMGWRREAYGGWFTQPGHVTRTPRFTTDPAADYSVLEHVRKTWLFSKRQAFGRTLGKKLERTIPLSDGMVEAFPYAAMRYEPGDYSRAAMAVVASAPPATGAADERDG